MLTIVEWFLNIISCAFQLLSTFYVWSKLINKKLNFKNYRLYVSLIILIIVSISNYYINNQYIKIVTITTFLMFNLWYIFREKFKQCVVATLLSQLLVMFSEMIFAFCLIIILGVDPNSFVNVYFGGFLTNLIISIIPIILINIKYIRKIYDWIINVTDKISKKYFIIMIFIVMVVANIFTMVLYYDFNFIYLMSFNVFLTIICFIIVLNSLKNKNDYIEVYDKYSTTINSLKDYEAMLDRYRIYNHENKNELLTIRNMIPKNNKKVISYIDSIVDNHLKDNDKIAILSTKIPSGGLRGLIYSKILLMNELNIEYELDVSKNIKTVDLINNVKSSTMIDVCRIIGVYLDNAIQSVEKLKKKMISINIYLNEDYLIISVSNNYKGTIEIEKIEEKGYTSKKGNHGYGLTLAKEIINNNSNLLNEKKISKDVFTQLLKLKI